MSSTGRPSFANPVRVSSLDPEEKGAGRTDAKRPQKMKAPTQVDSSQIPRPRKRSSSIEPVRRSNLKPPGKTPLRQQHVPSQPMRLSNVATPLSAGHRASSVNHLNLPSGSRHRSPSGGRHRSPSAERASGFGAKCPRKDNRPLNDKAYQNTMLNKIDQYFYDIQQTSLLNQRDGSLKPITLKIFVQATQCLVKLLDIKQELTLGNYMDEVPKIAKKLRYPGTVTKSWLKTANTMHSWPHVLGWLSWLVEVCEANDKAELAFPIEAIPFLGNTDEEKQRRTFMAILEMYDVWNADKGGEEAALMEKFVTEMNEEYGDIDKALEVERALLAEEEASAESGKRQIEQLDEDILRLRKSIEAHKRDERREIEEINLAEENIKRMEFKTKQIIAECNKLEIQIEQDVVRQNELLIVVKNQKMTVEKRDEISKQCSDIRNDIHQLNSHIKEMENELYALDLKFASSNQNLYKAVLAYNKDITVLLESNKRADVEDLKMPETNMLSPDFLDTLKARERALLNHKENIRKQCDLNKSEIEARNNEIEALEEKLRTLREENKDFVAKVHEQRACIQTVQRQAKEEETKLKEQIKKLKKDITSMEQSVPDVEAAANELLEAQDKLEAVNRRADFIEKRMERFFAKFYQILAQNRNATQATLEKLPKP